ncbi:MAG: EAL domain-containing protein [Gammaproteobacteria bacterium]|nr:EAL domain-containing protein [Gammaproteobacteria bacterium]
MNIIKDSLIRLLIIDESSHEAEQLISLLRSAGLHVKAEFAEDDADMSKILSSKPLDLVLFSIDLAYFTLKQAQQVIQKCGKNLSLIAMTTSPIDEHIAYAMNEGAQDLINPDNKDHFVSVIKRETFHIDTWRKTMGFEKELHESEKRCQSLLANSKDAVAYVHEGMHIYANEAYLELYGFPDFDSIEGMPIMDLTHSENKNELKKMLRAISKQENKENYLNIKLLHSTGESIDGKIEFSKASYDGEPCTQIVIRSNSDTSELEEQINYLHQHDLVTGLYNQQYFMDQLKEAIDLAVNGGKQCAILYISIDNFDTVRNTIGVSDCDVLLNDLAHIVKNNASDQNMVARFGNSSFVSICYSSDRSFVELVAKSLPPLIEQNITEVNGKSISSTCSVGICFVDENTPENPHDIIARCEKAVNVVQHAGGNAVKIYVPSAGEMTQEEEDNEVCNTIKEALKKQRISASYQPVVGIGSNEGAYYATTVEIQDSEGLIIPKDEFMPTAERSGLAKAIDRWEVMNAIKQIVEYKKNKSVIKLVIKLSNDSLLDPSLVRWIAECLSTARVSGSSLVFMVNETDAVNQLKATKLLFKGLKQLHCQFALDEFGMGLNPFQLIKHISADIIRINPSYMQNISSNKDNQNSVKEITSVADKMQIKAIAPSVNDASVLSVLWGLGANFVQGDFLQPYSDIMNYDFSSMGG